GPRPGAARGGGAPGDRRGGSMRAPEEVARVGAPETEEAAGPGGPLPDSFVDEAFVLLVDLLRIDTSNPGGCERPAAERCAEELRRDGLEPRLLEAAPGRTNLVCR